METVLVARCRLDPAAFPTWYSPSNHLSCPPFRTLASCYQERIEKVVPEPPKPIFSHREGRPLLPVTTFCLPSIVFGTQAGNVSCYDPVLCFAPDAAARSLALVGPTAPPAPRFDLPAIARAHELGKDLFLRAAQAARDEAHRLAEASLLQLRGEQPADGTDFSPLSSGDAATFDIRAAVHGPGVLPLADAAAAAGTGAGPRASVADEVDSDRFLAAHVSVRLCALCGWGLVPSTRFALGVCGGDPVRGALRGPRVLAAARLAGELLGPILCAPRARAAADRTDLTHAAEDPPDRTRTAEAAHGAEGRAERMRAATDRTARPLPGEAEADAPRAADGVAADLADRTCTAHATDPAGSAGDADARAISAGREPDQAGGDVESVRPAVESATAASCGAEGLAPLSSAAVVAASAVGAEGDAAPTRPQLVDVDAAPPTVGSDVAPAGHASGSAISAASSEPVPVLSPASASAVPDADASPCAGVCAASSTHTGEPADADALGAPSRRGRGGEAADAHQVPRQRGGGEAAGDGGQSARSVSVALPATPTDVPQQQPDARVAKATARVRGPGTVGSGVAKAARSGRTRNAVRPARPQRRPHTPPRGVFLHETCAVWAAAMARLPAAETVAWVRALGGTLDAAVLRVCMVVRESQPIPPPLSPRAVAPTTATARAEPPPPPPPHAHASPTTTRGREREREGERESERGRERDRHAAVPDHRITAAVVGVVLAARRIQCTICGGRGAALRCAGGGSVDGGGGDRVDVGSAQNPLPTHAPAITLPSGSGSHGGLGGAALPGGSLISVCRAAFHVTCALAAAGRSVAIHPAAHAVECMGHLIARNHAAAAAAAAAAAERRAAAAAAAARQNAATAASALVAARARAAALGRAFLARLPSATSLPLLPFCGWHAPTDRRTLLHVHPRMGARAGAPISAAAVLAALVAELGASGGTSVGANGGAGALSPWEWQRPCDVAPPVQWAFDPTPTPQHIAEAALLRRLAALHDAAAGRLIATAARNRRDAPILPDALRSIVPGAGPSAAAAAAALTGGFWQSQSPAEAAIAAAVDGTAAVSAALRALRIRHELRAAEAAAYAVEASGPAAAALTAVVAAVGGLVLPPDTAYLAVPADLRAQSGVVAAPLASSTQSVSNDASDGYARAVVDRIALATSTNSTHASGLLLPTARKGASDEYSVADADHSVEVAVASAPHSLQALDVSFSRYSSAVDAAIASVASAGARKRPREFCDFDTCGGSGKAMVRLTTGGVRVDYLRSAGAVQTSDGRPAASGRLFDREAFGSGAGGFRTEAQQHSESGNSVCVGCEADRDVRWPSPVHAGVAAALAAVEDAAAAAADAWSGVVYGALGGAAVWQRPPWHRHGLPAVRSAHPSAGSGAVPGAGGSKPALHSAGSGNTAAAARGVAAAGRGMAAARAPITAGSGRAVPAAAAASRGAAPRPPLPVTPGAGVRPTAHIAHTAPPPPPMFGSIFPAPALPDAITIIPRSPDADAVASALLAAGRAAAPSRPADAAALVAHAIVLPVYARDTHPGYTATAALPVNPITGVGGGGGGGSSGGYGVAVVGPAPAGGRSGGRGVASGGGGGGGGWVPVAGSGATSGSGAGAAATGPGRPAAGRSAGRGGRGAGAAAAAAGGAGRPVPWPDAATPAPTVTAVLATAVPLVRRTPTPTLTAPALDVPIRDPHAAVAAAVGPQASDSDVAARATSARTRALHRGIDRPGRQLQPQLRARLVEPALGRTQSVADKSRSGSDGSTSEAPGGSDAEVGCGVSRNRRGLLRGGVPRKALRHLTGSSSSNAAATASGNAVGTGDTGDCRNPIAPDDAEQPAGADAGCVSGGSGGASASASASAGEGAGAGEGGAIPAPLPACAAPACDSSATATATATATGDGDAASAGDPAADNPAQSAAPPAAAGNPPPPISTLCSGPDDDARGSGGEGSDEPAARVSAPAASPSAAASLVSPAATAIASSSDAAAVALAPALSPPCAADSAPALTPPRPLSPAVLVLPTTEGASADADAGVRAQPAVSAAGAAARAQSAVTAAAPQPPTSGYTYTYAQTGRPFAPPTHTACLPQSPGPHTAPHDLHDTHTHTPSLSHLPSAASAPVPSSPRPSLYPIFPRAPGDAPSDAFAAAARRLAATLGTTTGPCKLGANNAAAAAAGAAAFDPSTVQYIAGFADGAFAVDARQILRPPQTRTAAWQSEWWPGSALAYTGGALLGRTLGATAAAATTVRRNANANGTDGSASPRNPTPSGARTRACAAASPSPAGRAALPPAAEAAAALAAVAQWPDGAWAGTCGASATRPPGAGAHAVCLAISALPAPAAVLRLRAAADAAAAAAGDVLQSPLPTLPWASDPLVASLFAAPPPPPAPSAASPSAAAPPPHSRPSAPAAATAAATAAPKTARPPPRPHRATAGRAGGARARDTAAGSRRPSRSTAPVAGTVPAGRAARPRAPPPRARPPRSRRRPRAGLEPSGHVPRGKSGIGSAAGSARSAPTASSGSTAASKATAVEGGVATPATSRSSSHSPSPSLSPSPSPSPSSPSSSASTSPSFVPPSSARTTSAASSSSRPPSTHSYPTSPSRSAADADAPPHSAPSAPRASPALFAPSDAASDAPRVSRTRPRTRTRTHPAIAPDVDGDDGDDAADPAAEGDGDGDLGERPLPALLSVQARALLAAAVQPRASDGESESSYAGTRAARYHGLGDFRAISSPAAGGGDGSSARGVRRSDADGGGGIGFGPHAAGADLDGPTASHGAAGGGRGLGCRTDGEEDAQSAVAVTIGSALANRSSGDCDGDIHGVAAGADTRSPTVVSPALSPSTHGPTVPHAALQCPRLALAGPAAETLGIGGARGDGGLGFVSGDLCPPLPRASIRPPPPHAALGHGGEDGMLPAWPGAVAVVGTSPDADADTAVGSDTDARMVRVDGGGGIARMLAGRDASAVPVSPTIDRTAAGGDAEEDTMVDLAAESVGLAHSGADRGANGGLAVTSEPGFLYGARSPERDFRAR